jgi:hypothetical protein
VDFHPHQQTVSFCNTEVGEIQRTSLFHNQKLVRSFYEKLPKAVVGIEASCTAGWFEQLMQDLGHELLVGNPTLIRARARSRHKSDKRDADLVLDLLLKEEFPSLWRRPIEAQSVLEQLRCASPSGQTSNSALQSSASTGTFCRTLQARHSNKKGTPGFNGS